MHFSSISQAFEGNDDFVSRNLQRENTAISLHFLKSVVDDKKISEQLINPFFVLTPKEYEQFLQSFTDWSQLDEEKEALDKILNGAVVLNIGSRFFTVGIPKYEGQSVGEVTSENVTAGPQTSLNENLDISLNLIRNRYRSNTLTVSFKQIGEMKSSKITIVYDKKYVDESVLQQIQSKINDISLLTISSSNQLQQKLNDTKWSLFPTMMITERIDRVTKNLQEGKTIILLEGSPFAVIAPAVFYDFFASMDDIIQLSVISRLLSFLRYIALFITVFLPAFYIAVVTFNPEFLQTQIALTVAGSRATVPYPSWMEVAFLALLMEFLIEASVRLPKTIGPTATTVGGLILGQAASSAGLVADVMIIVVSAVAITNSVIPINAMTFAIRIVRYPMILLASFFGMLGLVLGIVLLLGYLCWHRSFGKPYFRWFYADRAHEAIKR